MSDVPIYYLTTVNRRGQVTDHCYTTDRSEAQVERDAVLAKHPGWTCRIKVWR